jgi:hypothetical protein
MSMSVTATATVPPTISSLERAQPGARGMLAQLHRSGFVPSCIVDIGAYHGEWAEIAAQVWPTAPVLMIEANPEKADELERTRQRIGGNKCATFISLLGNAPHTSIPFYLHEGGSSAYHELTNFPKRRIDLQMWMLDSLSAA